MTIHRAGATPPYLSFALNYVIATPQLPLAVSQLKQQQIQIPLFQRGIVWRLENVDELLDSPSALFGTVIFADFKDEPFVLVDGLQRFATVTALLYCLYPEVLSPTPSNNTASVYFARLKTMAGSYYPIFNHNADTLRNHSRQAIRDSYRILENDLKGYVRDELNSHPNEFAIRVERMLIEKQIAIDPYFNFQRKSELTNTFINMNSQGIDLNPVDLLRAKIVEQTISLGWNPADTETMENDFTDIFEDDFARNTLKALGTLLDEAVEDPNTCSNVFPDWARLNMEQVDELLSFIESAVQTVRQVPSISNYLVEIFECGGFPFAITLLHFYRLHLQDFSQGTFSQANLPDFAGGSVNVTNLCHLILRACYRRLIDGTINRIGVIGNNILKGQYSDVNDIANDINPPASGSLSGSPDNDWLQQRLRVADKKRSARIFNACRLPPRSETGAYFKPFHYGRRQSDWNIDHLIPEVAILPATQGEYEAERLPNLAPLPANINKSTRNNPCSIKLGPLGPYSRIQTNTHLYIDWLVNSHYPCYSQGRQLDDQRLLVANSQPPIGDERIEQLVSILSMRL
jgi:hypothetical protein